MWWLNIDILAGLLALEVQHWIASTFSAAVHLVAPPDRQRQRANIVFCPLMMVEVRAPDTRSPRRPDADAEQMGLSRVVARWRCVNSFLTDEPSKGRRSVKRSRREDKALKSVASSDRHVGTKANNNTLRSSCF